MCLSLLFNRFIGLVGRVITNSPGDLGSIPGRIIPKTFKMVLDTSLLNTQSPKFINFSMRLNFSYMYIL